MDLPIRVEQVFGQGGGTQSHKFKGAFLHELALVRWFELAHSAGDYALTPHTTQHLQ